jgi:hypothetical protein
MPTLFAPTGKTSVSIGQRVYKVVEGVCSDVLPEDVVHLIFHGFTETAPVELAKVKGKKAFEPALPNTFTPLPVLPPVVSAIILEADPTPMDLTTIDAVGSTR